MNTILLLLLLTPALALDIDGVGTGTIGTNEIADLAVDTAKLGTDAVTGPKILSFVVDSNKLGTGAVKTEKISALAVDSSKIAALAVDSEKLALGSVQKAQIGIGAVETDRLASGAVTINKIAAGAVDTSAIGSGAVTVNKILDGAVQTGKLGDDSVDTKKLMYTAHRVQSLGVGDGAVAAGSDALTVRGTAALRGATTVSGSSLTVSGAGSFTGNVAIGPASTTKKLEVQQSAADYAVLLQNTAAAGSSLGLQIIAGGSTGDAAMRVQDRASADLFIVGGTGRIGVNSNPPASRLDVGAGDGGSTFRGQVTVTGSSLTVTLGANTPTAAIFKTTGFADDNISTLFLQDETAQAVGVGGRLGLRGLNDVGSYTSFATIQGIKELAGAGNNAGALVIKTNVNAGALTEAMRVSSDQRVGIGNSAPSTKLHLSSGTLTVDGTSPAIVVGSPAATPVQGSIIVYPGAAETIAAGGTITADACGGLKRINAAAAVTTSLVNTFTAPAAANQGCCMDIINVDTVDTITLDNNANFFSAGAVDVALGPGDTARVCSTGASGAWYQVGSTGNN